MADFKVIVRNSGKLSESALGAGDHLLVSGADGIKVKDGGTIGSATDPDAITIASSGNVTLSQNLVVTGDLSVSGANNVISSTVVQYEDTLLELGMEDNGAGGVQVPTVQSTKDVGLIFHVHDGSSAGKGALFFDATDGEYYLHSGVTETLGVLSGGSAATLNAAFVGDLTGDVTGNADTATALATTRSIGLGGDLSGSANFDGSANITITATIANTSVESGMLNTNVITGQTALSAAPASDDSLLIYDTSATALKEVTVSELLTNAGTFSSFDVAADSGSAEQVDDGETLTISGTTNQVSTAVSATNTVTISIDSTVDFKLGSDQSFGYATPTGTDVSGHNVNIKGQRSTGAGGGGEVRLFSTNVGGSGSSLNDEVKVFAATSQGAEFYSEQLQVLKLNASSGTIARFQLVGVDLAKATSADAAVIGMHGSFVDADTTTNPIVLLANNQVIQTNGAADLSSFSAGDQIFLDNSGGLTNSTGSITNNIYQVGYVVDPGTGADDGVFYLDVKHLMSL